jgi:hypothetical protein
VKTFQDVGDAKNGTAGLQTKGNLRGKSHDRTPLQSIWAAVFLSVSRGRHSLTGSQTASTQVEENTERVSLWLYPLSIVRDDPTSPRFDGEDVEVEKVT